MSTCETLQDRVLEDGADAVAATPELRGHLTQCPDCQQFLDELRKLNSTLQTLPVIDAPEALVQSTVKHVHSTPVSQMGRPPRWWNSAYWLSAAASFAVVGIAIYLIGQPAYQTSPETAAEERFSLRYREQSQDLSRGLELREDSSLTRSEQPFTGLFSSADGELENIVPDEQQRAKRRSQTGNEQALDELASGLAGAGALMGERYNVEMPTYRDYDARSDTTVERRRELAASPASPPPQSEAEPDTAGKNKSGMPSAVIADSPAEATLQSKLEAKKDTKPAVEENLPRRSLQQSAGRSSSSGDAFDDQSSEHDADALRRAALARAEFFLADLENTDNLIFNDPRGYWRNTYIPGDANQRLLRTRMRLWNRLPELRELRLAESVRANRQPLDVPDTAAMGLYLQADKAAVSGTSRLLLQIGLRGALRQGLRPTMNVSVVIDLSGNGPAPNVQQVRAIVTALAGARQPGDRFSLTIAGEDGGLLVATEDFRHGPLQVAMERLFGGSAPVNAAPVNLIEAITTAADVARAGDDPSAAFGSSAVLLVTGGVNEAQLPALQSLAHRGALTGVTLSVVDTSAHDDAFAASSVALERLVAAGQGQRRVLQNVDDAARIIDAELHAASSAVARAARLRIRLAPGVRLLDVLGSQRLDDPQAERVRQAERSIDQRLARNLGIQADRGEDEDGIQIVIPNFHAGDSHVILLDVLVPGPGPVADVTLRYKDLVHLRNGVARAELRLTSGDTGPGPLQRNVLKNRVAHELAEAARLASRYVEQDDTARAVRILQSMQHLLAGLREAVPGWSTDRELLADEQALTAHVAYLQNRLQNFPFIHRYAVDSLRYMAVRKLAATDEESQR